MSEERHVSPGKQASMDEDLLLMQRVAAGDELAVGDLYDRFGSLVYRMAYQTMPTRSDAEDVVQEVFVRLWRTADRYDPKRAALVTWVMLLARRHMVDRLRRVQARVRAGALEESWSPAAAGEAPHENLETSERFESVLEKIKQLPELQQIVVKRAYLGGQTLKQIGTELGIPLGTIKSALSRALVRLRESASAEESAA
ncbi:MAG: sigma-70 family RNA polymerase sigma factor [Phycisphaerales bacterium]|nr:sigma-70 family RNA polymerase sigma factor [Phycisphaerales bacterium]